jgi:ABC-type multidrug transport system fused ATPase/permease subunit
MSEGFDKSKSYFYLFSVARWVLGKHHSKILVVACLVQVVVALLDILFLALIGPLAMFLSAEATLDSKFSILGLFNISGNEIIFLIALIVLVKNISGLVVQRLVLNSFATREAEVGTALVKASLFSQNESFKDLHSSNLLQTITSTIFMLFSSLFKPIIGFISELTTIFAIIIGLMILSTEVAIVTICYFSFFGFLLIWRVGKKQEFIGKKAFEAGRNSLRSFTEIRLMSRELRLANKDQDALLMFNETRLRNSKLNATSVFITVSSRYLFEIIFLFGLGLVLIYLDFFQENESLLATLALLVAAGYRILPSLNVITMSIGNFRHAIALLVSIDSLSDRFKIRSHDLSFRGNERLQERKKFSGDLHLENVSYQYPISKRTIFTDFNLQISSRSTLLVQGASGAGKTTLIALITGSLSPQQGRIYANDGKREIIIDGTVDGISYLSQEVPLLDESFGYNIALIEPLESDFARLKAAADRAGILDRILQSPSGFNTQIGENGASLSAGERQRLGIARSLYAEPSLLILDEPTANLDSTSEKLIWETLVRIKGQLTILIVSHRHVPELAYDSIINLPRIS